MAGRHLKNFKTVPVPFPPFSTQRDLFLFPPFFSTQHAPHLLPPAGVVGTSIATVGVDPHLLPWVVDPGVSSTSMRPPSTATLKSVVAVESFDFGSDRVFLGRISIKFWGRFDFQAGGGFDFGADSF